MKRLILGAAFTVAGIAAGAEVGHIIDESSEIAKKVGTTAVSELLGGTMGGALALSGYLALPISLDPNQKRYSPASPKAVNYYGRL